MNRRARNFAIGITGLLLAGAAIHFVIHHTDLPSPPAEKSIMPIELNVTYLSRTNNTTDILRLRLESPLPYATARVLFEDPSESPPRTLRVVNLTADESRDVQLRTLPALFRVRGVIDLPGTSVLTKWVWQGHAHVLIANTPGELAASLEASP